MFIIIPVPLPEDAVLRESDQTDGGEVGKLFPAPSELVGLTVSEARSRWCGDVIDEAHISFFRTPHFRAASLRL